MGKDARGGAGVNDMRWGKTPAAADVIDLAKGMLSPPDARVT